ncbi:hypothetical protein C8J55DRAFT_554603 [Lentinula edodes]|uniref:Uncharacterized protein n=1 Tax=Lentinula lateritia TaxID=40482 RepID=A0A9W9E1K7_9AGAR|nr:hypothetical protein C8J55DRAFT_554603 [Lentinula edodes]
MPFCPNCSKEYTGLEENAICAKCRKLAQPGMTMTEKKAIQSFPACQHCSVYYENLADIHCGPCAKKLKKRPRESDTDNDQTGNNSQASVSAIHHRAAAWSGSASEKRLNQHTTATKQNKNLQRGTAIIEARANQRKLSGAQVLAVNLRPYGDKYASSLTVETVFTKLLSLMKEGFATSAHAGIVQKYAHNAYLDWTPSHISYTSVSGKHKNSLAPAQLKWSESLEHLFMEMNSSGKLSKSDFSDRKFGVECCVRVIHPDEQYDVDSDMSSRVSPTKSRKRMKLSTPISEGSQASQTSLRPQSTYTSSWSRRPSSISPIIIEYESHSFKKLTCHLSKRGDTMFIQSMEECTIDVPRNWRRFAKGGVPKGGYRGKGSFKYCIEAR